MELDSVHLMWEMLRGMALFLWMAWPVPLVIVATILVRVGMSFFEHRRLAKSGIADLDQMDGLDFERYLEIRFKQWGYQVQRTPYRGDYGADLILRQGDEKIVVQAKRYRGTVGIKAVQEAVGAIKQYSCDRAMVVTTSVFSREARTLAKANNVELWDRSELVKRLLANKQESPVLAATPVVDASARQATQPALASTSPVCVQCGKPVSTKVRDYCLDHAATFGGRIYCYEHQKDIRRIRQAR